MLLFLLLLLLLLLFGVCRICTSFQKRFFKAVPGFVAVGAERRSWPFFRSSAWCRRRCRCAAASWGEGDGGAGGGPGVVSGRGFARWWAVVVSRRKECEEDLWRGDLERRKRDIGVAKLLYGYLGAIGAETGIKV